MGLFNLFVQKRVNENVVKLLLEEKKKGQTAEQCRCIDFFKDALDGDMKKKKGCKCFKRGDMTMADYLAHVQNKVNELNLKQRAIEKIGLDESQIEEIAPVALHSFIKQGVWNQDYFNAYESTNIGGIYTRVTNIYKVTWIFFSATQIYTYTYVFDTISNNMQEYTQDFFYSDITCVRTKHEVEEIKIKSTKKGCGCLKKETESYEHRDAHSDAVQITVPGDSFSFECTANEVIEQSIQAAKAMIREKKQA